MADRHGWSGVCCRQQPGLWRSLLVEAVEASSARPSCGLRQPTLLPSILLFCCFVLAVQTRQNFLIFTWVPDYQRTDWVNSEQRDNLAAGCSLPVKNQRKTWNYRMILQLSNDVKKKEDLIVALWGHHLTKKTKYFPKCLIISVLIEGNSSKSYPIGIIGKFHNFPWSLIKLSLFIWHWNVFNLRSRGQFRADTSVFVLVARCEACQFYYLHEVPLWRHSGLLPPLKFERNTMFGLEWGQHNELESGGQQHQQMCESWRQSLNLMFIFLSWCITAI